MIIFYFNYIFIFAPVMVCKLHSGVSHNREQGENP
jgi:hypothetical protein